MTKKEKTIRFSLLGLLLVCASARGEEQRYEAAVVPNHRPVEAGEHPRLIFREGGGLASLKRVAQSEWGRGVVQRMHQALKLMGKATITGRNREVVREAGYKAAGHGAVYALEGDAVAAMAAKKTALSEVVLYPLKSRLSVMDRLSRLSGAALAYDLCYDAWDQPTRTKVRAFLVEESRAVLEKVGASGAQGAPGPEYVTAWATAGLVELAVLGDRKDPEARDRIAACEGAVIEYLRDAVAERGFGLHGESVKQAAFASGILPFVHANRLVLGRDLSKHPAVSAVLVPMIYQTVPDIGMAILGPVTIAKDRSGLFAMAGSFVPEEERPAVAWLFRCVGGDKYRGVVRPHQALYMLGSGLQDVEPAAPQWPRFVRSDRAKLALFRTTWRDRDDIVAVLHHGDLRILGMGARWASRRGLHSQKWSDSPGAGAMENILGFNTRAYRTTVQREVPQFEAREGGDLGSVVVSVKGRAERVKSSVTVKKKENGKKVEVEIPVPAAGPFEGVRSFGVDYTGRSGAPALFVLADRIEGAGEAPREWVLHAGYKSKFTVDGSTFTIASGDVTLVGTAVYPEDLVFTGESNPPWTNFIHAETKSEQVQVIMTLQRGKAPAVAASADGLAGKVTVGERVIGLSDGRIVFSD